MSIQLVAWALEQRTGSVSRKAVLLALANCHNHHTGLCCPSIKRIRLETECSESTVLRSLMELEDAGFIVREQRRRPNGSHTTTVYRFPHSEGGFPQGGGTPSPTVTPLEPEVRTGIEQDLAAAPRKRDEIWDTLTHVFGEPVTRTEQAGRGKVVSSLRMAKATPEEIIKRVNAWPNRYPDLILTPHALEKHWTALGRKPLRRR